jgi:hypothetical protein
VPLRIVRPIVVSSFNVLLGTFLDLGSTAALRGRSFGLVFEREDGIVVARMRRGT